MTITPSFARLNLGSTTRRVFAVLTLLVAVFVFASAPRADASHYRGATASYTISASGVVTVTCYSVWRFDFVGAPAFSIYTGVGQTGTLQGSMTLSASTNPYQSGTEFGGAQYIVRRDTYTFSMGARANGTYYANWNSNAWVSGINNMPESSWAIELKIIYTAGQASAGPTMLPATIDIIGRGFDYNQNLNSTDPDGTPVSYQLLTGNAAPVYAPTSNIPGIGITQFGTVSVPAASTTSLTLGRWVYEARVTDGSGATALRQVLVIVQDAAGNNAPVLGAIGPKTVAVGQPLVFAVSGSDPNSGQTVTVRAQLLPSGASFAPASGPNTGVSSNFSWTPTAGQEGTYRVNFEVYDNATTTLIDSELVDMTVTGANNPPVLTAIGNKNVANGATLTFNISATDPNLDQITYQMFGAPSGATLDSGTGEFNWTPTLGQYDSTFTGITFRALDNGSPALNDDETITITVGAGNSPPQVTAPATATAYVGLPFQFSVTTTDSNTTQTLSLFPGTGGLPPGSTFPAAAGPGTGIGSTFSWTPTVSDIGTVVVRFKAQDNGVPSLNTEVTTNITVSPAPPPSVTTLAVTGIIPSGAVLNASVNPNGVSTDVTFEYSTDPLLAGSLVTPATNIGAGTTYLGTSQPTTNLTPNTTYYYRAIGTSGGGTTLGAIMSFATNFLTWGDITSISGSGVVDANSIPSTGTTTFTNFNGQGYDLAVTPSGLGGHGQALSFNETGFWFEGTSPSTSTYAELAFRFYQTGTTIPVAVTGVHFRLEDAELTERFANFTYWNANDDRILKTFDDSTIFTYSQPPIFRLNNTVVENGSSYAGGTQAGKWIDIDLATRQISGFSIQAHRQTTSAGSSIMSNWTQVASPINQWRVAKFGSDATKNAIAGDNADPNGDGTLNFMAYGLGIEPLGAPNPGTNPSYGLDGSKITITFSHPVSATDITYIVEVADSAAGAWDRGSSYSASTIISNTAFTTELSRSTAGGIETITVRDENPAASASRFIRLRITHP